MTKLYVRVNPKTGAQTFFRCGTQFSTAWKQVEVDAATAKRLNGEQMLEVVEDEPADYVAEDAEATGAVAAESAKPTAAAKKK